MNKALIYLILKVKIREMMKSYKPIRLYNTFVKVLLKVLVTKIKLELGDLIFAFQATFVLGRKARDNIILIKENMHTINKSRVRVGNMVIELDSKIAYDSFEWSFIWKMLRYFGFLVKWINLIINLILCVIIDSTKRG